MLYVGENQQNFSAPHVFSQGFYVNPTPGDTGANPGDGLPETPYGLALPVTAAGLLGAAALMARRRRSASKT